MSDNTDPDTIAYQAQGHIDTTLLTSTGTGGILSVGYFNNGPLINYLNHDEHLQHIVTNHTKGVKIEWDSGTELISPASKYRTAGLVTDKRVLFIVGQNNGDELYEVPLTRVEFAHAITGIIKSKLIVVCRDVTYYMYTRKGDNTEAVAEFIQTAAGDATNATDKSETKKKTKAETVTKVDNNPSRPLSGVSTDSTPLDENASASSKVADSPIKAENKTEETDDTSDSAHRTESESASADNTSTSSLFPDEVPPLPPTHAVASLDEDAGQYIDSARRHLRDKKETDGQTALIRAHTDLCTALDHLHSTDGEAIEKINCITTELENDLTETVQTTETVKNPYECNQLEKEFGEDKTPADEPKKEESGTMRDPGSTSQSIEIYVQDPDESPIGGAQVTLDNTPFQITGKTDSQGRCVLTMPSTPDEGTTKLSVDHPDFESTSGLVSIRPGRVYDIRLETETSETEDTPPSERTDAESVTATADDTPSRPNLLSELNRLNNTRSRDVDRRLMFTVGEYHPDDYVAEFGSWDDALSAANIGETVESNSGSEDPDPATTDDDPAAEQDQNKSSQSTKKEDPLEQALREVGLAECANESSQKSGNPDNQRRTELIEELQELDERWSNINRKLLYSIGDSHPDEYEEEFGSLDAALSAAGIGETADSNSETRRPGAVADDDSSEDKNQATSIQSTEEENELEQAHRGTGLTDDSHEEADENETSVNRRQTELIEELQELDERWSDIDRKLLYSVGDNHPDEYEEEFGSLDAALSASGISETADREAESSNETTTESDSQESSGTLNSDEISIPEGRVDTLKITVLELDADPGRRRDARLRIQTEDGAEVPLDIWSTHDIKTDWEVGETYTLEQSRHKVWDTDSGPRHEFSSTKDLHVSPVNGESANNRQQTDSGEHFSNTSQELVGTPNPTKEDYIQAIKRVADTNDRVVKATDVRDRSVYSVQEISNAFGSWQAALDAADVDNETRLLRELNRVADELGHQPSTIEMNRHSHVSATLYSNYFGSYTEAVEKAFSDTKRSQLADIGSKNTDGDIDPDKSGVKEDEKKEDKKDDNILEDIVSEFSELD
ncbi:homing endonuclease associated repeat-containing protein [Natronorubrum thiooxidans]|uniref:Uncharacterized protein n=1 Tax=Natronorubrum thiooxidans TaxID=308853 RepID=A0A1N7GUC8_9EURY|nr:hypothetical protein [Natronorubrum thiooxidans]SIS16193.1 hypothetical protein SAMN05421752_115105 [Natronorubrum thiooxidans]